MATADADTAEVERLYELGDRLSSAKDKSQVRFSPSPPPHSLGLLRSRVLMGFLCGALQHAADYEAIIASVKGQNVKAKQLAAQLIPRYFGSFPALGAFAMEAMFDLVEMEELAVRVLSANLVLVDSNRFLTK
jgi:hypothetical protein